MTTVSDASIPPPGAACQPLRSHVPGSPAAESKDQRRRRLKRLRDRRFYQRHKDKWKSYRNKNRDRINSNQRKRRSSNPEKNRSQCRNWYRKNRPKHQAKVVAWISANRDLHNEYNRKTFNRYVRELHPIYLGQKVKRDNRIPSRENLSHKKTNIQLWRSKNLLKMMATAASLNP